MITRARVYYADWATMKESESLDLMLGRSRDPATIRTLWSQNAYQMVKVVLIPDGPNRRHPCAYVYGYMQGDQAAQRGEKLEVRSMSVGDIVEIDGKHWLCAPTGWIDLGTLPEPATNMKNVLQDFQVISLHDLQCFFLQHPGFVVYAPVNGVCNVAFLHGSIGGFCFRITPNELIETLPGLEATEIKAPGYAGLHTNLIQIKMKELNDGQ